jgi:hypothetical protein
MTSPGRFQSAPFSRPSGRRHHTTPTVTQAAPLNSTTKAAGEVGRRLSEQPSPRRVLMPEYARLGVSSAMHQLSERKAGSTIFLYADTTVIHSRSASLLSDTESISEASFHQYDRRGSDNRPHQCPGLRPADCSRNVSS